MGVSSVWFEGNPCNMHLLDLAKEAKDGVVEEGMVGYRFNTIGVSDGISMGTSGECRFGKTLLGQKEAQRLLQ